jgi:hypothetical protein
LQQLSHLLSESVKAAVSPTFSANAAAFTPFAQFHPPRPGRLRVAVPGQNNIGSLLRQLQRGVFPSPRLPPVTKAIRCVIRNPFSVAFVWLKSLLAASKTINALNYVLLFQY